MGKIWVAKFVIVYRELGGFEGRRCFVYVRPADGQKPDLGRYVNRSKLPVLIQAVPPVFGLHPAILSR